MNLTITQAGGGSGKAVEISEATFARQFNEALVHQVVVAYMAGGRQGTRSQKSRSDVRGSGTSNVSATTSRSCLINSDKMDCMAPRYILRFTFWLKSWV